MLESQINKLFSLPELKFTNKRNLTNHIIQFDAYKLSEFEVCPKCATKATKIHDHVFVHIKDVPIRDKIVYLRIRKRRLRKTLQVFLFFLYFTKNRFNNNSINPQNG